VVLAGSESAAGSLPFGRFGLLVTAAVGVWLVLLRVLDLGVKRSGDSRY